ncbi:MAG: NAD(P)/FAD-dependent oxidoreductase [Myxococcota bacterium]
MHSIQPEIAVVGAGIGGLTAAYALEQLSPPGLHVTVLEASDRLGGRNWTRRLPHTGLAYEAGVAELYILPRGDTVRALAHHLDLETVPLEAGGPTVFWRGHHIADERDLEAVIGVDSVRQMDAFFREATALRSPLEYADPAFPIDHPWAKRTFADLLSSFDGDTRAYLKTVVLSDLACAPAATNGVYGIDNFLIDDPRYCELYAIDGGNDALSHGLANRLRREITLNAPVRGIERDDDRWIVRLDDGTQRSADAVLLAITPRAIEQLATESVGLRRALDRHCEVPALHSDYLRITLGFDRPVWKDVIDEAFFVTEAFGGCTIYDPTPSGHAPDGTQPGILSWLIGGPEAVARMQHPADDLIEEALTTLPPQLAAARAHQVEGQVDRWPAPRARRERIAIGPAHARPKHRLEHGLCVTGDYMYDGTVNGAIEGAVQSVAVMCREVEGLNPTPERTIRTTIGLPPSLST